MMIQRFWNSFANQLALVVGLSILASLITLGLGLQSINRIVEAEAHLNTVNLQRTEIFRLLALLQRLIDTTDPIEHASLQALIQAGLETFNERQGTFRQGDAAAGIVPISNPLVLVIVDEMDEALARYAQNLAELAAQAPHEETEEDRDNLEELATVGVEVFTIATGLQRALSFENESVRLETRNNFAIILVVLVVLVALISFILLRAVRSLNNLRANTQKFSEGDFTARIPQQSYVEIDQIGQVFNEMAGNINRLLDDLTEQFRVAETARREAEKSSEVKSAFLASMSHELRTPLNSIINYTKFVTRGMMGEVNEKQADTLQKVVASGHHLLSLINDVLDISKIESGSMTLFIEDNLNMNEILTVALDQTKSLLVGKEVELQTEIADNIPLMTGDRKRLLQIVLNVMSNACKYTEKGVVKLTAKLEQNDLLISVQDTGAGIAAEDYEAVFTAFKQTDAGLRQGEGTGLGMPISKSLAEAHGGQLWFESIVNQGTTFFIRLPLRQAQTELVMAQ